MTRAPAWAWRRRPDRHGDLIELTARTINGVRTGGPTVAGPYESTSSETWSAAFTTPAVVVGAASSTMASVSAQRSLTPTEWRWDVTIAAEVTGSAVSDTTAGGVEITHEADANVLANANVVIDLTTPARLVVTPPCPLMVWSVEGPDVVHSGCFDPTPLSPGRYRFTVFANVDIDVENGVAQTRTAGGSVLFSLAPTAPV